MPTRVALFREDHPPSIERIKEFIQEYHTEGERPGMIAECFKYGNHWVCSSGYESADLTLKEVE